MPRQKESGFRLLESVAQALDCTCVSDLPRTDSRKLYEAFQALPAEGFPARLWLDALDYLSGKRSPAGGRDLVPSFSQPSAAAGEGWEKEMLLHYHKKNAETGGIRYDYGRERMYRQAPRTLPPSGQ